MKYIMNVKIGNMKTKEFKKKVKKLVNDLNFIKLSELLKKQRENGNKSTN